MNWNSLFSETRLGDKTQTRKHNPDRTSYERDFDRVVFSSAFRRLQDKTQVIPLPESDFVHTRLTHSLEVSCVGRSLGKLAGQTIIERHKLQGLHPSDFGAVVAAAALAHDIGNPPFGHSGEASISNYFANGKGQVFRDQINDKNLWADLTNFEGNANGFKLLTNYNDGSGGSINLTYSTLAAFTKYPTRSNKLPENEALIKGLVSQKKYGYFQSEREIFEQIFTHLEVQQLTPYAWRRHPLAYIVEAADDICYRIIDFEDGIRIGLIPFKQGVDLLKQVCGDGFNAERYEAISDSSERVGYLRARAINRLINRCNELFLDFDEQILSGKFDASLIDHLEPELKNPLEEIITLSRDQVYRSKNVLQIEAAGFTVVAELLDVFISAVNDYRTCESDMKKLRKAHPYSEKVLSLLPKQFIQVPTGSENELYLRILRVCEFVAGMTDGYAVTLYRRLKGIELPG